MMLQPGLEEEGSLHLISWNVAGLKTTLEALKSFNGGLGSWMARQKVDILCLQEVKLPRKDVADEPRKYAAVIDGYQTFWCFNDGSGGQRLGLNGVTTFVRDGLTVAANAAPLGDPALDSEGRCILTDHGSFVVFNVT